MSETPDIDWRVRRLRAGARLPTRAHPDDAGWDLYYCAPEGKENEPPLLRSNGDIHVYELSTGLSMAFSAGWVFKIEARSGLAVRYGISVLAGVVDAGFRGELIVLLGVPVERDANGVRPLAKIAHGDRIAQGIFLPVPRTEPVEVFSNDDLPASVRGVGGWGSSGR